MAERRRPSRPWPWWGRVVAWVVVLGATVTGFVAVVGTGSAATTVYSPAVTVLPTPSGSVGTSVAQTSQGGVDGAIQPVMVGPTVAVFDPTGVTGRSSRTGTALWSYHRPDAKACAGGATATAVVLVVGRDGRCDEAIGFDAASGARSFQRTLEAGTPSRVTIQGNTLIAFSASRLLSVDLGSGYQRFTYDTTQATQADPAGCQILDASGQSTVSVLQRCRETSSDAWTYTVVALTANEDKGSETARYPVGTDRPSLLGTLTDGTAVLALKGGAVVLASGRGLPPVTLAGVDGSGRPGQVVLGGRGDLLVVGTSVYALDDSRTTVVWQAQSQAVPAVLQDEIALLGDGRIDFVDPATGTLRRSATVSPAPLIDPGGVIATLRIVGAVVAVTGPTRYVTYA